MSLIMIAAITKKHFATRRPRTTMPYATIMMIAQVGSTKRKDEL